MTSSVLATTSKHCFEQNEASFPVGTWIYMEEKKERKKRVAFFHL